MTQLKHFSGEELAARKKQYPHADIKDFAILDDGLVYAYYDTEAEALADQVKLDRDNQIHEETQRSFWDLVERLAQQLDTTTDAIQNIIKRLLD